MPRRVMDYDVWAERHFDRYLDNLRDEKADFYFAPEEWDDGTWDAEVFAWHLVHTGPTDSETYTLELQWQQQDEEDYGEWLAEQRYNDRW